MNAANNNERAHVETCQAENQAPGFDKKAEGRG